MEHTCERTEDGQEEEAQAERRVGAAGEVYEAVNGLCATVGLASVPPHLAPDDVPVRSLGRLGVRGAERARMRASWGLGGGWPAGRAERACEPIKSVTKCSHATLSSSRRTVERTITTSRALDRRAGHGDPYPAQSAPQPAMARTRRPRPGRRGTGRSTAAGAGETCKLPILLMIARPALG